jgi:hypothetical protein
VIIFSDLHISLHRFLDGNRKITPDFSSLKTWPKEPHMKRLGYWGALDLIELITNLKVPLTRGRGWSPEEVEKAQIQAKKDFWKRRIHSYFFL